MPTSTRTNGQPPDEARAIARATGLRYSTDARPGITRRRSGTGFSYRDAYGTTIRDPEQLARIRRLAIPPAWTDVWISPWANGHLQATGRDARGRKQYRYHADWRARRETDKFDRMLAFAAALPRIRRRCEKDLGKPGVPRDKVLADVVRLLESTLIQPFAQWKAVWLPPALLVVAQVAFGLLGGVASVVLAAPLAAVVMVLVQMLYVHDALGDTGIHPGGEPDDSAASDGAVRRAPATDA